MDIKELEKVASGTLEGLRHAMAHVSSGSYLERNEHCPNGFWSEEHGCEGLAEYLDVPEIDALSVDVLRSDDRAYAHIRVLLGYGGPNVVLHRDFSNDRLEVTWWSAPYVVYDDVVTKVLDYFEELFA